MNVDLLDTSAVIALPALSSADLPLQPAISTITLAELSAGPATARDAKERARRQSVLQQVEADFDPIPFDAAAARAFGRVAADLRAAGREPAARAIDALIASVAIANDRPLYTCNPDDFRRIDGLTVVAISEASC